MVPAVFEHSLVAHTAQLLGERAAVEVEVVGQLLAVERNIELGFSLSCCLAGKIGQQTSTHIFRRGAENAGRKRQVFLRGQPEHPLHQPGVPAFAAVLRVKQGKQTQKQNLAVRRRHRVHHKRLAADGVGFGEHAAGFHVAQYAAYAPEVVALDMNAAGHHDSHFVRAAARLQNYSTLLKAVEAHTAEVAEPPELLHSKPGKER